MIVGDFDGGIHYCAVVLVDATGEVDVFGIHEVARVEKSYFAQCITAEKHETS